MPKKVYELAKEIGIGAIDLVEQLKSMGLNVRNHMVTLQDDEVEKALAGLKPADDKTAKTAKKKVTKKKVAKKKVVKKVVKKATSASSESDVPAEEEAVKVAAPTTKVVRKKKVIKKAAPKTEDKKEEYVETPKLQGLQVVEAAPVKVVKKVEQKAETTTEEAPSAKSESPKKGPGVYKEKMHSFTPISMPDPKPAQEKKTETKPAGAKDVNSNSRAVADSVGADKAPAKKRMADLAAMVSKKGGASSKAKDMTQVRADEGLKLATTVTGNRAVYTPLKRKKIYSGATKKTELTEVKTSKRVVHVFDVITASDLAQKLSQKFESLQNECLNLNLLVNKEDYIGIALATQIAEQYDYRVENKAFDEDAVIGNSAGEKAKSDLPLRNAMITVMGHVDHGKTTLLDTIRSEKVTEGEAGGITQHIGAYSVKVDNSTLTFLDTPGHAAFGSMRQRGADVTDIVILVVAADDGVMPQTVESIKYARNSGSPIIVAINKMDKEGANPERIKQELTEYELVAEEWGGDTIFAPISAINGEGIDSLLESVKLQAEMMELRANPKGSAQGVIIEAKVESGRGPVATVLVQSGTLKKGDALVCGECYGRARTLMDDTGKVVNEAGPSIPVQILGLNVVPSPGDVLNVVKNERESKKIVENRVAERKKLENSEAPKVASLEDFFSNSDVETGEKKILKVIIRTDVQGSFEAVKQAVETLGNDEVGVEVIAGGAGAITDNDIILASSAEAYVFGFNMRPVTSARKLSEEKGIEIRTYSVIYHLIDDVTLALEGMLDPEKVEKYIGRAEVRETFQIPKIGTIAGCAVIDGKIERGCNIRLLRDGKIMFDGKLSTLKRFKDEVKEVSNGYECGMALEGYDNIKNSDLIEAYLLEEKKRKLETETYSR